MTHGTVRLQREGAVACVFLNRPEIRNAFDGLMLEDLLAIFKELSSDGGVRVVVITGEGKAFCAGADLNWMKRVLEYTYEENYQDCLRLTEALHGIYTCTKPVIGRINGPAIGGGTGIVAACDIAIASETAFFALSETKLGLAPAIIAPYLLKAVGERNLRRFFLTGERFSAAQAAEIGLVNAAVPEGQLDASVESTVEMILSGGPEALAATKESIREIAERSLAESLTLSTEITARLRVSAEGQEGMSAFLEKRKPRWMADLE